MAEYAFGSQFAVRPRSLVDGVAVTCPQCLRGTCTQQQEHETQPKTQANTATMQKEAHGEERVVGAGSGIVSAGPGSSHGPSAARPPATSVDVQPEPTDGPSGGAAFQLCLACKGLGKRKVQQDLGGIVEVMTVACAECAGAGVCAWNA